MVEIPCEWRRLLEEGAFWRGGGEGMLATVCDTLACVCMFLQQLFGGSALLRRAGRAGRGFASDHPRRIANQIVYNSFLVDLMLEAKSFQQPLRCRCRDS